MKDFITRIQSDLNKLQKTFKKEGDDLVKKIKVATKKAANKQNLQGKRREFEKLLEEKLTKFEPALSSFLKNVTTSANKYGIDLSDIEKRVGKATRAARSKLGGKKAKTTSTTTKRAPAARAKKATKTIKSKATSKPAAAKAATGNTTA